MTFAVFISAALALLLAPGPTNALMSVAGAQSALRGVARLAPAMLLGYLTAILPLTFLGSETIQRYPAGTIIAEIAGAIWVFLLAIELWGGNESPATRNEVTASKVYLTTLLNPKALVFGLVLLPAPWDPEFAPKIILFIVLVCVATFFWGGVGALTQAGGGEQRLHAIQRLASVWLAIVSMTLLAGAIRL